MNALERLYYMGYKYKTGRDVRKQKRLPLPVISVGNITTGGTGKTPAVVALAAEAARRGLRPCVLTRGYGGKLRGPIMVGSAHTAREVGDEPLLMAGLLHDTPVIKCADRYTGGMFALDTLESSPELFILDDGFQHRRVYRDIDIVLVSALSPFGGGRLLPMGRLREPLQELARASVFVITKSDAPGAHPRTEIEPVLHRHNPDAPVFLSTHAPGFVRPAHPGGAGAIDDISIRGESVYAFCAIAEPESFVGSLQAMGAHVAGHRFFRDHYEFTSADLEVVESAARDAGAHWIMTTEKDIMRLRGLGNIPPNCASLGIDFGIDRDFFDHILHTLER